MLFTGIWEGWALQRVGKRKEKSLVAPDGAIYSPLEISQLQKLILELDYLQVENKRLKALIEANAVHLTKDQIYTLQTAATVIESVLPRSKSRRFETGKTAIGITHDNNDHANVSDFNNCKRPIL